MGDTNVSAEVTGKVRDIHERGQGDDKQHDARLEVGAKRGRSEWGLAEQRMCCIGAWRMRPLSSAWRVVWATSLWCTS